MGAVRLSCAGRRKRSLALALHCQAAALFSPSAAAPPSAPQGREARSRAVLDPLRPAAEPFLRQAAEGLVDAPDRQCRARSKGRR